MDFLYPFAVCLWVADSNAQLLWEYHHTEHRNGELKDHGTLSFIFDENILNIKASIGIHRIILSALCTVLLYQDTQSLINLKYLERETREPVCYDSEFASITIRSKDPHLHSHSQAEIVACIYLR